METTQKGGKMTFNSLKRTNQKLESNPELSQHNKEVLDDFFSKCRSGEVGNDLKMIFDLIYETNLLFKLPVVSKYGVPGRNHSKYYVMSSNMRSRIKEVYLINDAFEEDMKSILNGEEDLFSNEERLEGILDSMEANGYDIDDRKEIVDFLQNYQEYGLPYLD